MRIQRRLIKRGVAISHSNVGLRPLVASAAVAMLAGACRADTTNLYGVVSAGSLAGIFQSFDNVEFATLSGLHQADLGNVADSLGSLATPSGFFTLAPRGSSSLVGSASGAANATVDLSYLVTSTTLPVGTPTQVLVNWAVAGRVTALGKGMTNVQDGGQAILSSRVTVFVNEVVQQNSSGSYSERHTLFDGFQVISSGTLDPQGDFRSQTYPVLVGQTIRFYATSNSTGGSFAFAPALTDGDVQHAAVWGITCLTGGASVVLQSKPTQPAPPASNGTIGNAAALLPPRPDGTLDCFVINSQPTPASACAGQAGAFSASVSGAGPFAYAWQIRVPGSAWMNLTIAPQALPCGGSARATLPNAAATGIAVIPCAGVAVYQVRCQISNSCGVVSSDPTTLSVCAADYDCDGFVTGDDFDGYVAAFELGDPASDFDGDGFVTGDDFDAFVEAFEAGC